jgi:cytochrome c-type biogenesis protein CcmH
MKFTSVHKPLHITYFITLFLILVITPTSVAFAQGSSPTDDEVNAIAKKLYCPVCESTPLDVCPTEACRDWREQIRQMLADGSTEKEILQYFVDQYGDRVLAEPPRTGLNWLIYILPPAIILIGALILFRALRSWTRPVTASAGPGGERGEASDAKDEYVTRLEEELKKRK